MKITIDSYTIESDERQYILKEVKVVKSGKDKGTIREFVVGYYSTFRSAVAAWKDRDIKKLDCTSLDDVLKRMDEQDRILFNILPNI